MPKSLIKSLTKKAYKEAVKGSCSDAFQGLACACFTSTGSSAKKCTKMKLFTPNRHQKRSDGVKRISKSTCSLDNGSWYLCKTRKSQNGSLSRGCKGRRGKDVRNPTEVVAVWPSKNKLNRFKTPFFQYFAMVSSSSIEHSLASMSKQAYPCSGI